MVDANGKHVFRVNEEKNDIRLPGGRLLESTQYSLDNSDNKAHNEGERKITNRIMIRPDGTINIALKYQPKPNETQKVRIARRKAEVRDIDASLVNAGDRSAYVNILSNASKSIIDKRIATGESREKLSKEYLLKYNKVLANYSDGIPEEKVIMLMMNLKGAEYYAKNSNHIEKRNGSDGESSVGRNSRNERMDEETGREREKRGKAENEVTEKHSDNQGAFSMGEKKLQEDIKQWNGLCDLYEKSDKSRWKANNNGTLYKFLDMPLVLEMISNNHIHLSVYGSFFAHALRDIHKGMDLDVVRKLPAAMTSPMMIFKDKGKYIFVLETEDKNGVKVIVPVELEKTDEQHGIINVVNTAYGKTKSDGVSQNENWIISHIEKGHLVYVDKEKALLTGHHGLMLRVGPAINSALSKSSILTENDVVNEKLDNPTRYSISQQDQSIIQKAQAKLEKKFSLSSDKVEVHETTSDF